MWKSAATNLMRAALALLVGVAAAPSMAQPQYQDEFNGSILGAGWSSWDGYALQFPSDTANHASLSVSGGRVQIGFPGGVEHNMWWLRDAQIVRPYLGSGIYEIKVDSSLTGDQQFGLLFQSSPTTFLKFMFYAYSGDLVRAYVERFAYAGGQQHKTTFLGTALGLAMPAAGPFYVRVRVTDADSPAARRWRFEWSRDGNIWNLLDDNIYETGLSSENAGVLQQVGVFVGNQPTGFHAFNAQIDHFRYYSSEANLPLGGPANLGVRHGSNRVDLAWDAVPNADSYAVYAAVGDAQLVHVATTAGLTYTDLAAANGVSYRYAVAAIRGGQQGVLSAPVVAVPHTSPVDALPTSGLMLLLSASELSYGQASGTPVSTWLSARGALVSARMSGSASPTLHHGALNGQSAVRFDGADDHLALPSGFQDFTAGMSLFIVKRPSALTDGFKVFALGNGPGLQNIGLGRAAQTGGYQYFNTDSSGSFGWFNSSGGLTAGETSLVSVLQNGGSANASTQAEMFKNGALLASGTVYVPPVATRSVNYIGKTYWSEGMFQGDIAEIILYNRKLGAAEVAAVHQYISTKYGLVVDGTTPPPLSVPSGLVATAGSASVALNWNAVSGASGYRVLRSTVSGGPYTLVASPSSTSYTDTGLNNGTTYHYVLRAYDAGGESANSQQVSATPAAVAPAAPGGLGAVAGNATVALSWNAVNGAAGYRVYRGTTSGGPYTLLASPSSPGYTDNGVSNGSVYYYVVRAHANGLDSVNSAEVSALPNTGLPDPNPALPAAGLYLALDAQTAAQQYANGALVTSWQDTSGSARHALGSGSTRPTLVTDAIGGKPALRFDGIDDHLVLPSGFQDFTAGMSLFIVKRPSALTNAFKMLLLGNGAGQQNIGLGRAGQTGGYQFFTNNSSGSYGWFDSSSGLVAGQTALLSVLQDAGAANSASYAELAKDGTPLFGSLVYVPPVTSRSQNYIGKTYWSEGMFQGDIAEIILYNRKLGAAEVAAVHQYISTKYGLVVDGTTPPPLSVPSGLVATAGSASVALNWNAVSGASGYRVLRSTVSGGPYTLVASPSSTSYTDTGLNNGTTYHYVLRAYDAGGESANSQQVSATPAAVAPAAPGGLGAVAGNATVALSWNAVNGAAGYRVYRGTTSGGPYTLLASPSSPGYTDNGVSNGSVYYYVVRAHANGLDSVNSAEVSALPNTGLPDPNPALPAAGLYLALDAQTAAQQYANGALVTSWQDTSGSARHALGSGSTRPTLVTDAIGGKPALRFDGIDDHLVLPSGFQDFTAGMSLFIVKRPSALTNAFKMLLLGNGAGQQNIGLGRAGQTGGYQFFTNNSSGSYGWFDSSSGLVAGQTALLSVLQDAGAANSASYAELAKDGTPLFGSLVYVPPVTSRSQNYIGKTYWSEGMFQGDIAEIILYNRKLGPAEVAAVQNYLAAKYGIVLR
jgi:fibronectin type 3 domain-containing protein